MARETGEKTRYGFSGDKKYQRRARRALPLLVRQAKAEEPIYYSDLAHELGMPNPRNLNYVLGAIGNELLSLSEAWGDEVPPIQSLVINQRTGLPGEGISWFAPDAAEFKSATLSQRRAIVDRMLSKVYSFARWDDVLSHFDLEPAEGPAVPFTAGEGPPIARGGESKAHRELKEFIAKNPGAVGLRRSAGHGDVEYCFGSSDAVDVLFRSKGEFVAVEVKASAASSAEVARGLYQCVKYHALLKAELKVTQRPLNARSLLAIGGSFPAELVPLRNTLGVQVVDNVSE